MLRLKVKRESRKMNWDLGYSLNCESLSNTGDATLESLEVVLKGGGVSGYGVECSTDGCGIARNDG